jgi:type II secretory pathway component GspD/PulD (secretin)
LGVLLVLVLITPLLAGKAGAEAAKKPAQWLKTVRGGQHGDYSSVVFEFDSRFFFQQPVVKGKEVHIVFQNTGTAVVPFRRYKSFDSWLRLVKDGNNLRAQIGIPTKFPYVSNSLMKEPERLVIRFGQKKTGPSTPETTPPPAGSPKDPGTIGNSRESVPPDSSTFRARSPLDVATAMTSAPPNTDIGVQSRNGSIAKAPPPPDAPQRRSYNYLDLDIRQALSALAQDQEANIIMSPEVTGKISVHLNHVTLEEAIRSIALAGGLTYRKEEGDFYVYKPKLIADPQAGRLQIRVFRLKFAAIDKVQEILAAIPGMRTVRLHESSKTIIVEDTPENIAKIEEIIRSWDVAPMQVLIEARIMEVTLTDDMSMGVDWQRVFGDLTIGTSGFASTGAGFGANLVTAAGSRDQFTAALSALQVKTNVNTLSTPKILAVHGKMARVQVGGRQGYKSSTVNLGVTTEIINFLDTGTILDITPYIDSTGNILLDVKPQINSVTFDSLGTPFQKTTTVSTSMMAKNGQTIFIGGLIEDKKSDTRNIIPCLGSIPGMGLIFGQMRNTIGKSELIVLITPQIIDLEAPSAAALEKTKKLEDALKKEPLPLQERLFENMP